MIRSASLARRVALARLANSAIALSAWPAVARAEVRWDFPTAYPDQNFHTVNIRQFVSDIEQAADGQLRITVYPNASVFSAPEISRAVQGGQAQIGETPLSALHSEDPLFGIDTLPFLATSYARARKLYRASKSVHDQRLARYGLLMLYSVPWPPLGIYSKKRINTIADMQGIKWRAQDPSSIRLGELVHARPVIVQASGLQQALAGDKVEAFTSSSSTGYESAAYRHVNYFYDARLSLPRNAVLVNRRSFDALDKRLQQAVLQAAIDAEARGWKWSQQKNDWYLNELRSQGMIILQPSDRLRSELMQIGRVMLSEWLKRSGDAGQAILKAYRER